MKGTCRYEGALLAVVAAVALVAAVAVVAVVAVVALVAVVAAVGCCCSCCCCCCFSWCFWRVSASRAGAKKRYGFQCISATGAGGAAGVGTDVVLVEADKYAHQVGIISPNIHTWNPPFGISHLSELSAQRLEILGEIS